MIDKSIIIGFKVREIIQKYKQLTVQSSLNFLAQILNNVFNIMLFFYIANFFNENDLAVFLFVTAISRIISFLFDGGFNQLVFAEFKNYKFRNSLLKIFFYRNISSVFILILIFLFFKSINFLTHYEFLIFIIVVSIYLNSENINYFFSILMSLNKNIYLVFTRIIILTLCFVALFLQFSFQILLIFILTCNFLGLCFVIFNSNKFLNIINNNNISNYSLGEIFKIFLGYSLFIILAKGAGEINSNIDMIFINKLTYDSYTNLYGLINKLNQISLLPHLFLGSMILPYFASIKSKSELFEKFNELRKIHILTLYFFALLTGIFFILFNDFIKGFDLNLINLNLVIVFNLIICFFIALNFHIQSLLIINKYYKELFTIASFSLLVNFFANYFLVEKYHIYGAMISTILSHLTIYFFYIIIFLRRYNKNIFINDLKTYLFIFILNIFLALVAIFFLNIFQLTIISTIIFLFFYTFGRALKKPLIIK